MRKVAAKLTDSTDSGAVTQIFILCRDRWEYLQEAINSIIGQLRPGDELIISDNSVGDSVKNGVSKYFPEIQYIERRPNLSAHEHFRRVIEEASAEFLVLFHDDDVFGMEYLGAMRAAMDADTKLAAVACNALLIKGDVRTNIDLMGSIDGGLYITDTEQLLQSYFRVGSYRPAPFPGYFYRTAKIKGLFLDANHGGKYADVSFLTKILSRGPIFWIYRPLMLYRLHDFNDTKTHSVGQSLSLLRYLMSHHDLPRRSELVMDYKFKYFLYWFLGSRENILLRMFSSKKKRVITTFLFMYLAKLAWKQSIPWNKIYKKYKH